MKRKILAFLIVTALSIGGCGQGKAEKVEEDKEIVVYYIDDSTGEIETKSVSVQGEIEDAVITQLKDTGVLSEECEVESVSVNEVAKEIDLAVNKGLGDYVRGMGTTGSEQVLECLVKTYSDTYECDRVKITEDGQPLDMGHVVLDGYISYE